MQNRKLNRLKGYDYSQDGMYFVTICTKDRENVFGVIENEKMILNHFGMMAEKCWLEIPDHFPNCKLDEFVIMPDHIHGILIIENDNDFISTQIPWQTKLSRSVSSIIRGFKIGVTKYFRQNDDSNFAWQKSFHDHIIRDEISLNNIREYILNNPAKWKNEKDTF